MSSNSSALSSTDSSSLPSPFSSSKLSDPLANIFTLFLFLLASKFMSSSGGGIDLYSANNLSLILDGLTLILGGAGFKNVNVNSLLHDHLFAIQFQTLLGFFSPHIQLRVLKARVNGGIAFFLIKMHQIGQVVHNSLGRPVRPILSLGRPLSFSSLSYFLCTWYFLVTSTNWSGNSIESRLSYSNTQNWCRFRQFFCLPIDCLGFLGSTEWPLFSISLKLVAVVFSTSSLVTSGGKLAKYLLTIDLTVWPSIWVSVSLDVLSTSGSSSRLSVIVRTDCAPRESRIESALIAESTMLRSSNSSFCSSSFSLNDGSNKLRLVLSSTVPRISCIFLLDCSCSDTS
ncbi:hypothetical protein BpHYR1_037745 [Brachionus plicatilis]|uniref:Uncharacterized protein n=1 Tax=Brachionus plicatilis TaxID=10195 RepID=A0A3M7RCR7_BRAPC|nr:hypothetical protein BpHYR1_037745 [Brachionus plicatilis]